MALIVPVLPLPRTSWLLPFVNVSDAKVGVALVLMLCGSDKVTAPVAPEAVSPFVVSPVMLVTPALATVIVPEPLVMVIPLPWVKVARV